MSSMIPGGDGRPAPSLWSSVPLGTVPPRARPAGVPAGPGPEPRGPSRPTPAAPTHSATTPPTRVAPILPAPAEDAPTDRLAAEALTAHRALRAPLPPGPVRRVPDLPAPATVPSPPGATPPARTPLPMVALAALLAVAAGVLVPWPGTTTPWVGSSPLGLALLAGVAVLAVPVVIALLTRSVRGVGTLIGLPLMVAAAAATVVVAGGDLTTVLASQGLDPDVTSAPVVVAVVLLACLLVGIGGLVRGSSAPERPGATTVLVGVSAGVSLAALFAVIVVLAAPSPQTAEVANVAGATPATATSGCPAEAANTLPEAAVGAPVVAHDTRVHIALCQGASGALYYYGADDRTHLTITLPASRSEDSWIATNNGVTYFVTEDNLMITKPGVTLADEALTSGWSR